MGEVRQLRAAHRTARQAPTFAHAAQTFLVAHRRRLYAILRPSSQSLHRVPSVVPVFVRNAREAQIIIDTNAIE